MLKFSTPEKRLIEVDCVESMKAAKHREDESEMGNGNVCDAQTEAALVENGVLLSIIPPVRTLRSTKGPF